MFITVMNILKTENQHYIIISFYNYDYEKCLVTKKDTFHKMRTIKSNKHQLYTVEIKKTSLTVYDNKRYILGDGISSVPYNHYSIK